MPDDFTDMLDEERDNEQVMALIRVSLHSDRLPSDDSDSDNDSDG